MRRVFEHVFRRGKLRKNSFAEYEQYFPLKGLGVHCEAVAHTVNEIACSPRLLTTEEADSLDIKFEPKIRGAQKWGISRLADDLSAASLQTAGGILHSLGLLLKSDIRYPLTPSILARSALENSALVMYLNEDADPWIRTVRAVNVVVNGYENSGGRNNESPYSEATAEHIKMKQAFASQGYGKSQKLLNYTDLVAEYFDGFQDGEMYSRFNRSVHHNVVRQIELALAQDRDGRQNAVETFEIAIRAAIVVGVAAFSLQKFRHCSGIDVDPIHALRDVFEDWNSYLDRLGQEGFVD